MTETLTVRTVPADSLRLDPGNVRKHGRRNLDAIGASLAQFGQRRPLVVMGDMTVIAGNGTLEAARSLGWTEIAVTVVPAGWTADQARAYALADNRTAELASWDDDALAETLGELDAQGWDMAGLGFDGLPELVVGDADDEVPDLPVELRYRPTATAPESCDRIQLEAGAARRCVARCPGCDRPVRKLYAPPSDAHFFCRDCQGLTYRRSARAEKQARMRATWDELAALQADLQALIGPLPGGVQALAAAGVAGGPPAEQHHELEALLDRLKDELPLAPQELRIYCLRLARAGLSVRHTAALVGSSKSSVGRFRAASLEGVSIWLLANERRERLQALRWSPKTMTLKKLAMLEREMRQLGLHLRKASDLEVRALTVAKADQAAASKQEISAAHTDTRLGRQEIPGEPLAELPGALWKRSRLEKLRVWEGPLAAGSRRRAVWQRVVVAVAATSSDDQETGIIVAALGLDDHSYVLGDHSGRYPVERWGALVVSLYQSCKADCVVSGANNAGRLVRAWLGQLDADVPVRLERASYGSDLPAEPVSALYDQSRVRHIGAFSALEDQMVTFIPHRKRDAQGSATRVAALVWAITELVVRHQPKRARSVRLSRR